MLDFDRGKPGRGPLHGDEHDEREFAIQRVRSGYLRRAGHARAAIGFGNPLGAAGLEQQLRSRSQQSRLLPLLEPAEAFLPVGEDGFSGNHRRHGGQREHLRHLRRTDQARKDELCTVFNRRHCGAHARLCRRGPVHRRSVEHVRRRGGGGNPEHAELAALHLRARLRTSRRRQPVERRRRRARSHDPLPRLGHVLAQPITETRMATVVGVDFGTLSVRAYILDSECGLLASASSEYPLHRKREDPEYATQAHEDHMRALSAATRKALEKAATSGDRIEAIALDTTGSSVIPVDKSLRPLDEYYLWCDHRAKGEAREITEAAHREGVEAIKWCGGVYSSEWGFSKLLHWLRHNPSQRANFASAFEHCDMVAATLCGITDPKQVKRSICAMGHKWMWNRELGGLPPEEFLVSVDPLLQGVREKLQGEYATSDKIAGTLSSYWAEKLGLKAGIPIPVGAFDAHWDAIGAGCRTDDMVNVIGTSTCIIGITPSVNLVPGVCGVVQGSVHPHRTGIEAGLSAVGDIFSAIAARAGTDVKTLSQGLEDYRAGQTGLLRMTWDNGDRTVLVNPNLRGITLGWNLQSTAQDEMFAAIEGTAFHTRVILDRMAGNGVTIRRVINAGGIPQKNDVLNRVYANVLGRPVLVPSKSVTSLGSAIFAFLAAGTFRTIEEAQEKVCPPNRVFEPDKSEQEVYNSLYALYRKLYFALGQAHDTQFGDVLPTL